MNPSDATKPSTAGTCFVMSPFGGDYDDYHDQIFVPAIRAAGLRATRADDLYRPSPIVSDIWSMIRECKVGLADLTERNANVLYELGLAHAITKPVVLVTRSLDDVPFDLRGLRHVTYNVNKVKWAEQLQADITQAIHEVIANPTSCIPLAFVRDRTDTTPVTVTDQERRQIALEQQIQTLSTQIQMLTPNLSFDTSMAGIRIPLTGERGMPTWKIMKRRNYSDGTVSAEIFVSEPEGAISARLLLDTRPEVTHGGFRDIDSAAHWADEQAKMYGGEPDGSWQIIVKQPRRMTLLRRDERQGDD